MIHSQIRPKWHHWSTKITTASRLDSSLVTGFEFGQAFVMRDDGRLFVYLTFSRKPVFNESPKSTGIRSHGWGLGLGGAISILLR